jgi:hypothetical protein
VPVMVALISADAILTHSIGASAVVFCASFFTMDTPLVLRTQGAATGRRRSDADAIFEEELFCRFWTTPRRRDDSNPALPRHWHDEDAGRNNPRHPGPRPRSRRHLPAKMAVSNCPLKAASLVG